MAESQVRQNCDFHAECEAGINKQINLELYAFYTYLSMVRFSLYLKLYNFVLHDSLITLTVMTWHWSSVALKRFSNFFAEVLWRNAGAHREVDEVPESKERKDGSISISDHGRMSGETAWTPFKRHWTCIKLRRSTTIHRCKIPWAELLTWASRGHQGAGWLRDQLEEGWTWLWQMELQQGTQRLSYGLVELDWNWKMNHIWDQWNLLACFLDGHPLYGLKKFKLITKMTSYTLEHWICHSSATVDLENFGVNKLHKSLYFNEITTHKIFLLWQCCFQIISTCIHLPFIAHTHAGQTYVAIMCTRLKNVLYYSIVLSLVYRMMALCQKVFQSMNYLIQECF